MSRIFRLDFKTSRRAECGQEMLPLARRSHMLVGPRRSLARHGSSHSPPPLRGHVRPDRWRPGSVRRYLALLEVEKDTTLYGDECKFGGGKMIREGMEQAIGVSASGGLDCGDGMRSSLIAPVFKGRRRDKDGVIAGIGKAGNPDVMAGVTPRMIVGVTTEVIAGEGLVLTAGGFDAHIHFICPQQAFEALASGVTPSWRRHRSGHGDQRHDLYSRRPTRRVMLQATDACRSILDSSEKGIRHCRRASRSRFAPGQSG